MKADRRISSVTDSPVKHSLVSPKVEYRAKGAKRKRYSRKLSKKRKCSLFIMLTEHFLVTVMYVLTI